MGFGSVPIGVVAEETASRFPFKIKHTKQVASKIGRNFRVFGRIVSGPGAWFGASFGSATGALFAAFPSTEARSLFQPSAFFYHETALRVSQNSNPAPAPVGVAGPDWPAERPGPIHPTSENHPPGRPAPSRGPVWLRRGRGRGRDGSGCAQRSGRRGGLRLREKRRHLAAGGPLGGQRPRRL